MAQRHVAQGRANVAKQRALVARLRAKGLPTATAEPLLTTFESIQLQHENHLARLDGEQRLTGRSGPVRPIIVRDGRA